MNRQTILKKIAEYSEGGKKLLTRQQFIEVGMMHRELPTKEKSWDWLVEVAGWYGSGESYRSVVSKYLRKTAHMQPMMQVEESTLSEEEEKLSAKSEMFLKARQKLRDERTAYNRLLRSDSRVDELKDSIIYAVKELTKLPKFSTKCVIESSVNCEAILMLSDWHIGQESSNFYNTFNLSVAKKRIEKVVNDAIMYCKTFGVHTLHVLNLGDLIEGIINTNARVEQTEDAVSQLMTATELFAQALNKLQAYVSNVTYRSVTDNHSRALADKHQSIARENFNRLTDWFLEERLRDTNVVFMKDNLDIGLGRFTLKNGMKVAFMHGHEDSKDKMLQNIVGATHEWTDIVCMGHLHNPAEHVYQDMRLFINGSLCGTGPYALSKRLFTTPSQKMIIVDSNNFINLDISAE